MGKAPEIHIEPGARFGFLVYVGRSDKRIGRRLGHVFLCDCGKETVKVKGNVLHSKNQSCGCKVSEIIRAARTTHGASRRDSVDFPTFVAWQAMLWRCNNKARKDYPRYGGRGITVCRRWLQFGNFYSDMGRKPPGLSIDRVDVNGDYEPGNCRWADNITQANNRRTNVRIEFNGESLTVKQWSRKVGVADDTLRNRIKRGVPIEIALTRPTNNLRGWSNEKT